MGTPEFAVVPLETIFHSEIDIIAIVTVPDKPAGRGLQLKESPVKKFALTNNIPVLQPVSLKDPAFIAELRQFNADLFVVVAFRMLPKEVWQLPAHGTINLHASLLPRYRGAAPINHAIMNGDSKTGLTTFFIDEQIDTGKIIGFTETDIPFHMTAGELHDELMLKGSTLLLKTIRDICNNQTEPVNQQSFIIPDEELPVAPKIKKEDCRLIPTEKAEKVYNKIRGLSPYPGAFTTISVNSKNTMIKVLAAELIDGRHKSLPGTILTDNKTYVYMVCNDGIISITELQAEGKRRMKVEDFLRGVRSIEESIQ
ncbi:MAG: methionyl-tRNA formyltransferase [Bacteroidetes bacterium HGW-Bacteroidetes-21]|nr:MAG: methionyl-tRNA formyltransferase [Bacteroidetes bacterium HGW-Bacteroidetes-21]